MRLNEVVKQIVDTWQALYVKENSDCTYDVATEHLKGYTLLDATTANVLNTVYNALTKEISKSNFNNSGLLKAIDISFRCLK